MTEEIKNSMPDIFKNLYCSLKTASRDETNRTSMTESMLSVIRFDRMPKEYARGKGWRGVPKSNDALYVSMDGRWFFIEFKNGSVELSDVYRKIYDSIIMVLDLGIVSDLDFFRNNGQYILVYNSKKYGKVSQSQSRDAINDYFFRLAQEEERLFGIEKLEQYLFKETHTYSKEKFEKVFVKPMEEQEHI